MCLTIGWVPSTKRDSNCVPVYKSYYLHSRAPRVYRTPYMGERIPDDGVLYVRRPVRTRLLYHDIYGGAIHAYCSRLWCGGDLFVAYAFGIMAYGYGDDCACSLLYIPKLDFSEHKEKRMRRIKKWLTRPKGPTNREVSRLFPKFVAPDP